MPITANFDKYFDNFIIYRPKDIVSGDFYWFTVIENQAIQTFFVSVVDCTGHGVPGAFMSMISNSILNEIVKVRKIHDPKEILLKLDIEIRSSLKQDITENRDGMDVVMCKIENGENNKITFCGAKRPLYFYNSGSNILDKIKGDRRSVGGTKLRYSKVQFTNSEIDFSKGDEIILSTDGFVDQNNNMRKRFGSTKFHRITSTILTKPTSEQKQILETELDKWQGTELQRDDITMIGIKF